MFQSRGALVKSTTTLWQGPPSQWPGVQQFPNLLWNSYASLYRSQLWVATVIDKRAKAAARLPFKVYDRSGGGRVDAGSSPFGQLMARPSRMIDPFSFWLWTVTVKDIYGEAPWLKIRDRGGRPVELIPIHPTSLIDDTDQDGKTTWTIRLPKGDVVVKRSDLVLHREFNPDTVFRGMSKLEPLRATLENEEGARRANSALWRNGGRPSVVLEHPNLLNDGAIKRLSAQWNDIHSGVDNWAKAAILEEGMKANIIPLNVEDLQYVEARRLNREEVCAAYDVPPPVVHILDRATFSNITEQMRSMYRDTMGPVLGSLESTVEFELRDGRFGEDRDPDFSDGVYGEFLLDEVLRGAFEARAAAYQMADYMTIAEKREKENLPFIQGTDHVFLNSATLPLGPDGSLLPIAANEDTADPQALALMLQKLYLSVGVVITAEEARDLMNQAGANLTGPPPERPAGQLALPAAAQRSVRSVLGQLGRVGLDDVATDDHTLAAYLSAAKAIEMPVETVRASLASLMRKEG